jgi:hypothetical protein
MLVQYRDEPNNVSITRTMFAPRRGISDASQWFKEARKIIPQIPLDHGLLLTQCTPHWITWELEHPQTGARSYVVIDRKA